jgi:hypothetical protein
VSLTPSTLSLLSPPLPQPWYFSFFWALVRPFLKAKLVKRLHLLGKDLDALHKVVPPAGLPRDFGGSSDEPLSLYLDNMERLEKERGSIGGFAIPMSVDDPTGAVRRAKAAAAEGAEGAGAGEEGR